MSKVYLVYDKDDNLVSAGISKHQAWSNIVAGSLKNYFMYIDEGYYTDEVEV
jgi:hypothetical protein